MDVHEIYQHIGFITDFVDEFAGKSPEWILNRDPRLREQYAGLDLEFQPPDDLGVLYLPRTVTDPDPVFEGGPNAATVDDWPDMFDDDDAF